MSKLDIIIPCYKAQGTLFQALASIAIQSVAKDVHVHISVDADGIDYSYITDHFANAFGDLTTFYLAKNGGPAVARQYALERSSSPYVAFLDADDTFAGAYTLELLLSKVEANPHVALLSSVFYEKRKDLSFVEHKNDLVWLHGKIYKRDFIDQFGISFNDTRANEDVGFNTKFKLLENADGRIMFTDTLSYYWQWNETGITRKDDLAYTYTESFFGYVDNLIDAFSFALQYIARNDEFLVGYAHEVLTLCYIYTLRIRHHRPELEPKAWEYSQKYFDFMNDNMDTSVIVPEHFNEIHSRTLEGQIGHFRGIIIDMTFHDFIEVLLA